MADGGLTLDLDNESYRRVIESLQKLQKIDKNAVVKKGLQKGISPVRQEEKQNLKPHKKTGNLQRALTTRLQVSRQRIYLGFRRGKGKGNHSHLVESGTTYRWTKSGHYTGSVRKNAPNTGWYFAQRAFEHQGDKALNILMETIKDEINRIKG